MAIEKLIGTEFVNTGLKTKFNNLVDETFTGCTFSGNTIILHRFNNTNLTIENLAPIEVVMNNEVYSYSTWSGDTLSGATRQAVANKFNSIDSHISSLSGRTDIYVTGGTFNNSTLSLTNISGGSIDITGFTDYYTTASTLSGNTIIFTRNDGNTYEIDLSTLTTTQNITLTGDVSGSGTTGITTTVSWSGGYGTYDTRYLSINSGTTASNGLTKTGNDFTLGGTLTQNTDLYGTTDGTYSLTLGMDAGYTNLNTKRLKWFEVLTKEDIVLSVGQESLVLFGGTKSQFYMTDTYTAISSVSPTQFAHVGSDTALGVLIKTDRTNPFRYAALRTDNLTDDRIFQFPNASGTLALTTDIPVMSSYAKLDGSNQPFTGNIRIETTSGTSLVLKGSTSDNTTKTLSVTDSNSIEYFYLRNDKTAWLNGSQIVTTNDLSLYAKLDTTNQPFTGDITIYTPSLGAKLYLKSTMGAADNSDVQSLKFTDTSNVLRGMLSIFNYFGSDIIQLNSDCIRLRTDGNTSWLYLLPNDFRIMNTTIVKFTDMSNNIRTQLDIPTGKWTYSGTAQNLLTIANGIKIANNTDSAATAGGGSIRYSGTTLQFSNGSNWLTASTTTDLSGYAKLDATNQPFTGDIHVLNSSPNIYLKASGAYPANFATGLRYGFSDSTGTYRATISSYYDTGKYNLEFYLPNNRVYWVSDEQIFFNTTGSVQNTKYTASTGVWSLDNGSAWNLLVCARGIKIGVNGDSAATAGGGSIRYGSSKLEFSDGSNWLTLATTTDLVLKGSTSDNTTKALSVTDSSNVEYFYLRNDKTAWLNGSQIVTTNDLSLYAKLDATNQPFTGAIGTQYTGVGLGNIAFHVEEVNTTNYGTGIWFNKPTGRTNSNYTFRLTSGQVLEINLPTGVPNPFIIKNSGGSTLHTFAGQGMVTLSSSSSAGTLLTLTGAGNTAVGSNVSLLVATAGPHTQQAASTEVIDVNWGLNRGITKQTGAVTTQRAFLIQAPTYGFMGASTITNAATFAITNAPAAGTNATITNSYALWVQAGKSQFDGNVGISGTSQNTLTVNNGIKIANNTDSAATAGGGSIRYSGTTFYGSDNTNWNSFVTASASSIKVTAAAPYTNDGYIDAIINGVPVKLMTTA